MHLSLIHLEMLYCSIAMNLKLHIPILIVLLSSFVLFVNITTPASMYPIGMLVFYALVYLCAVSLMQVLLRISILMYMKFIMKNDEMLVAGLQRRYSDNKMRLNYMMLVVSVVPTILLAMNSLGVLTALEGVLVVTSAVVACFYIFKRF